MDYFELSFMASRSFTDDEEEKEDSEEKEEKEEDVIKSVY